MLVNLGHYYGFTPEQIMRMPSVLVGVYMDGCHTLSGASSAEAESAGLTPDELALIRGD